MSALFIDGKGIFSNTICLAKTKAFYESENYSLYVYYLLDDMLTKKYYKKLYVLLDLREKCINCLSIYDRNMLCKKYNLIIKKLVKHNLIENEIKNYLLIKKEEIKGEEL